MINTFFDKIFIINLEHRKDRWTNIKNNLEKFKITNYERFNAIRPEFKNIPSSSYRNMNKLSIKKRPTGYPTGCIGCLRSHVEILKLAKKRNYQKIIILEDDAFFKANLDIFENAIKQLDSKFDIFQLAGNHRAIKKISDNIALVNISLATLGYGIQNHIFDYIIENAEKSGLEIDKFYIKFVYTKKKSYCIQPHIISNITSFSDINRNISNYHL